MAYDFGAGIVFAPGTAAVSTGLVTAAGTVSGGFAPWPAPVTLSGSNGSYTLSVPGNAPLALEPTGYADPDRLMLKITGLPVYWVFSNSVINTFEAVTVGPDGSGSDFSVACYLAGTLVQTAEGPVPVEALRAGDAVLTLRGPRPLRLIGFRHHRLIRSPAEVLPVRIAAGALGPDLPLRDLWVSPGHCLFLEGRLVQAIHLENGATIRQMRPPGGTPILYVHLLFDAHEVIFAEGLPAESFADHGNLAAFANGHLAPRPAGGGRMADVAPRLAPGEPALEALRRRLRLRAAALAPALAAPLAPAGSPLAA